MIHHGSISLLLFLVIRDLTSHKALQNAHLQHAGGLFDALFQAFSQEFIEVLVQFLLCRGQFLFSLFCPGFVIG